MRAFSSVDAAARNDQLTTHEASTQPKKERPYKFASCVVEGNTMPKGMHVDAKRGLIRVIASQQPRGADPSLAPSFSVRRTHRGSP